MKINKKETAEIAATVIFMVIIGIITVVIGDMLAHEKTDEKMTAGAMTPSEQNISEVNVIYYDDSFNEYLDRAAKNAEDSIGIKLNCINVSEENYLENINDSNISGEDIPDIYIMNSTMLEKAVLAGITQENKSKDIYNEKNYSKTAVSAVTYKGKMQAYPLNFNTSVMVYNSEYVSEAPAFFDDIINFSNSMNESADMAADNVLLWDVKDLIYNYAFAGAYLEYGGKNGDDPSAKAFTGDNLVQAMNYYHNLNQIFSIDISNSDYDSVVEKFSQGKAVYAIVGTDIVQRMDAQQEHAEYAMCALPDMNGDLKTRALAVTNVAVVNPYAADTEAAQEAAEYISYKMADEMYELTGMPSGRKDIRYDNSCMETMLGQYDNSVNLPKLMEAGDFGARLENVLNGIWSGEDIQTALGTL